MIVAWCRVDGTCQECGAGLCVELVAVEFAEQDCAQGSCCERTAWVAWVAGLVQANRGLGRCPILCAWGDLR